MFCFVFLEASLDEGVLPTRTKNTMHKKSTCSQEHESLGGVKQPNICCSTASTSFISMYLVQSINCCVTFYNDAFTCTLQRSYISWADQRANYKIYQDCPAQFGLFLFWVRNVFSHTINGAHFSFLFFSTKL